MRGAAAWRGLVAARDGCLGWSVCDAGRRETKGSRDETWGLDDALDLDEVEAHDVSKAVAPRRTGEAKWRRVTRSRRSPQAGQRANVSADVRANRKLLADAMRARGFIPYDKEWWHFTLRNEPFPNSYFDFPVR